MGCSHSLLSIVNEQFSPDSKESQQMFIKVQSLISKGKFKDAQLIGDDLFSKNQLEGASAIYRLLIRNNARFEYPFEALGNPELAQGVYLWSIPKWYIQRSRSNGKSNPYDALSLCNCQMRAYQNTNYCNRLAKWYRKQLTTNRDPRLMVGLANLLPFAQKKQAIQLFTKAIDSMPQQTYLFISLAFTYLQSGNKEKTIQYAGKALQLTPQNGYSDFLMAMAEQDIQVRIQRLCKISNENIKPRCLKQISILYSEQRRDPESALGYLQQSMELQKKLGSQDFELNIRQIGLYLSISNYRVYFQLASEQIAGNHSYNPIRKQCQRLLIDSFIDTLSRTTLSTKDLLTNIAYFCSQEKEYFTRFLHFAKLLFERKVFKLGLECVKQSVKHVSTSEQMRIIIKTLRQLLTRNKINGSKLSPFASIINQLLRQLGQVCINRFNSKQLGQHCFLLAIHAKPNCALSHYNLGQMYRNDKCFQQALDHFSKALQIEPNFTLAEAQKAFCYMLSGDEQQGLNSFRKISIQLQNGNCNLDQSQRQCLSRLTGQFSQQIEEMSKKKSTGKSTLSDSDKEKLQNV